MKKFSQIDESLPEGHRWIHHGVTMTKGNTDGNQKFRRVTFSTAHPDHSRIAQPDGKYGHYLDPSAHHAELIKHPEYKRLKKEGWSMAEGGQAHSIHKRDVMKAFDEHEKHHRRTYSRAGYKRAATNAYNLEK